VFAFAVAGLLIGHSVSYLLAMPDPHHRDLALRATGHDYLPAVHEAALILMLAGFVALLVRAWTSVPRSEPAGLGPLAGTLASVQVVAFAGQEVVERLVANAPLGDLVHDHVLVIGTLVQIVVGLVGALILGWLARQAEHFATSVRGRRSLLRPAATVPLPAARGRRTGRVTVSTPSVRAPPLP
jgi:hypothetical protein